MKPIICSEASDKDGVTRKFQEIGLRHGFSFGEFARRHVDACADDARFSIHEDSSGVEKIMMLTSIEDGHGWRSAEIGEQTITLIFDQPQPK